MVKLDHPQIPVSTASERVTGLIDGNSCGDEPLAQVMLDVFISTEGNLCRCVTPPHVKEAEFALDEFVSLFLAYATAVEV